MPPNARFQPTPLPRRTTAARARRSSGATGVAYTLFYSATGIGIALLIFAGFTTWSSPIPVANLPAKEHQATIRLNQSAGKGQCRQVSFNNTTGQFAEAGAGPCPNDLPDELQLQNADRARARTEAISKSFR